ncbi:MAG TPA: carboxypeptidase regulatory-like domain-containing protein [Acidobacteriaceae bacterium]|nr:carboxypeptidase regulatory-like domain-containing protein [Acidobacteriaceae bacterium]
MMHRSCRSRWASATIALLIAFILTIAAPAVRAQSTTAGAIAGTVSDQTGAVVPGASVDIRNNATNARVHLTADGSGFFRAPLLEPGTYSVTITAPSFATYRAGNVEVFVAQTTTLLPHLALATATTKVVVTEQTPAMNLESPSFTDELNSKALQSIPINNKRWSSLAMTTPGVVSDANGYGLVSVRGISTLLNNVEIDGADDNQAFFSEERGRTREAYSTSFAAVREFAVNTGVYSAQYGRAAGGVITSVTRSGTNQLHGQAYFWDRESNWAAYTPFATITTLQNGANVTSALKPEDERKIYGFTAGGPLIKNKLFWEYTYDQHTHVFPNIGVPYNPLVFYTLPSAALVAGETCNTTTGALSGAPASAVNDANACTLAARQGISYSQAAYDWAALTDGSANVTVGNYPGAVGITDPGLTSDIGESPRFGYQEINMPKLDWQINGRNHLSLLYNRLRWDSPGGVQTDTPDHYARDTNGNDFVKLDYGVGTLFTMITTSLSNEVLYQYSRELDDEGQQPYTPYTSSDINNKSGNIPELELYEDGVDAGSPYYSYRKAYPDERKWQANDIVYWNRGHHALSFGAEFVHNYDLMNNTYDSNGVYDYDWDGNYFNDLLNFRNGVVPSAANPVGCNSSASENGTGVTGTYPCFYEYTQGFGPPTYAIATLDSGLFVQDDWRATHRLTVDLGLRWDKESLPGPDPNLTSATGTFVPYVGLTNNPSENTAFGPRVGFAWNLFGTGKTVLHGGWGMYYGRLTNGNLESMRLDTGSPNGQYTVEWFGSSTGSPTYPSIEAAASSSGKPNSYFMAPSLKVPEVQEFDLSLQHELGRGTVVQASYLGSMGRELPNFLDVNLNPATTARTLTVTDDPSGQGRLGPTGSTITVPVFTSYGNTTNPELDATDGSGSVAANFGEIGEYISNINSSYNAFVVEILNRSLRSIQFDANYTWSHALDYSQNTDTEGAYNNWYNPYSDYGVNYGNSPWDIPNRLVAYALYTFPSIHAGNWVKWIANGWSVDDSFQMQNGLPFTAGVDGKPSGAANGDLNGSDGSSVIPEIGINTYRYPRDIVDDARLQKNIAFEGDRTLELSANAYNLANHENITGYEATYMYYLSGSSLEYQGLDGANDFMVPNAANNSGFLYTPREIELVGRFTF